MTSKEMPNLITFGATEYMDGALTYPVLNELFLRGAPSRGRGRSSRGRSLVDISDQEEEDRERRRQCLDLEAVDLTGCVSPVFVNALTEFILNNVISADINEGDDARRTRAEEPLIFPGLQRLGLRGVKSLLPHHATSFVLAFPSLTHLDLSGTRASPELLTELGNSSTVRLKSLALARCVRLTGESIRVFLVESVVTSEVTELNLYGDLTFSSPLSEEDLQRIVSEAPCFVKGQLLYLDLSSAPVTEEVLRACPPQRQLRSLGLSYIPGLPIRVVADFLETKASNVEVLTLLNTCPELSCGVRIGGAPPTPSMGSTHSCIALHSTIIRPLCCPPFSFSLSLSNAESRSAPTKLRVIELSTAMLAGLGAGANGWKTVRSKGGRGWYVDTACGWIADGAHSVLARELQSGHPLRVELERLSDANGNVTSGVGWHARKMEVGSFASPFALMASLDFDIRFCVGMEC